MKDRYLCPNCKKIINIDEDIILTGKNNKGEKRLIYRIRKLVIKNK